MLPTRLPSGDAVGSTFAAVTDSRSKLLELEQIAWTVQSSVRATRAQEDLLRRGCGEHERRLRHLEKEQAAAREDFRAERLEPLLRAEAQAAEGLRREQAAEAAAQQAAERQRGQVLDLSGDCGSLLLGSVDDSHSSSEAARALALLRTALPAAHAARRAGGVEEALRILEEERADVRAMLLGLPGGSKPSADGPEALCEEAAALRSEVKRVEAAARRKLSRAEDLRSQALAAAEAHGDAEDALLEAATLRRETGLWRRQQAEWEKSQARMLQLTGDLQHERESCAQRQALVAKRLRELKRELPAEGGDRMLEEIRTENSTLQREINRLEQEKAELLKKKEGLVSFVNSRMTGLQATPGGAAPEEPRGRGCYPPSP